MADLKRLFRERGSIKHKLTNFEKYIEDLKNADENNLPSVTDVEVRYEHYSQILKTFDDIQINIEAICNEELLEQQYEERTSFENRYYSALSFIKTYLSQFTMTNLPSNSTYSDNSNLNSLDGVKLPIIRLKTFTGAYEDWLEFKDTFKSLIHNNSTLSPILKFHYLRNSLEGTAARVIQSLEFSAQNYIVAWELLCARFDNNRILVNNHVNSLFNLEPFTKESSSQLRKVVDNVSKHLRALQVLELPVDQWDILIIHLITSKIDKQTFREWEEFKSKKDLPTLQELFSFLRSKADLLETLQIGVQNSNKPLKFSNHQVHKFQQRQVNFVTNNMKCNFCKGAHVIYNCGEFLKLDVPIRKESINKLKLCVNCLRTGHNTNSCQFGSCRKCKLKHNTLLHIDPIDAIPSTSANQSEVTLLSNISTVSSQVLLSTILIKIKDKQGDFHTYRALLDSGAQSNFATTRLCKRLKLVPTSTEISIIGINQVVSNLNKKCHFTISSCHSNFSTSIDCFILPIISSDLPCTKVDIYNWKIPENIPLADPQFNQPNEIDLLIGAGLFWDLLVEGTIKLGKGSPVLQNSKFGWIVSGNINNSSQFQSNNSICNFVKSIPEDEQLKKFWEIEEVPHKLSLSEEDILCEAIFKETTTRDPNGRFIVRLPLKHSIDKLGDSKLTAIKRFISLERKFQSNSNFKLQYQQFIDEYKLLGHMSLVSDQCNTQNNCISYYLPHHGVIKESSLTTRLRVVFDGSSPSNSGWSLNDLQFIGPKVLNDIFPILLRFRKHTYVISADVTKMYRQILIHPDDRPLQRILWRSNPSDDFSIYQLNTVTYGTSAAPYLAIRCLNQLAYDNENQFSLASHTILHDFYVDDLLTGSDNLEELSQTCQDISAILQSGSFILRKWISNNSNILTNIDDSGDPHGVLHLGENESSKILGVLWSSHSDSLSYQISSYHPPSTITKRQILSDIAHIHDPLGLLSPSIILSKIIVQRLWLFKLNWDDVIPDEFASQWFQFRIQLIQLNNLSIPRHAIGHNYQLLDVHCFCDASQQAYAACVYLRSHNVSGDIQVHLLCAKTKVAPLKMLSIPRLELCAALLGSQLMEQVIIAMSIDSIKCYYWTDSQVTLWWLNTEPNQLQVFVGNRVSKVQSLTNAEDWHYVNTKQNPADLASRGVLPEKLLLSTIWWNGPQFLSYESQFPITPINICNGTIPELKKQVHVLSTETNLPFSIFNRFSNLHTLKRVTTYCFRFLNNCKRNLAERITGDLTVYEINNSWVKLVKLAQQESFENEINMLKSKTNSNLISKYKLSSLSPFIDQDNLLRVGGRLQLSSFNYDTKHPILLSSKHPLTKLIFSSEHQRLLHAGPQLLLATIRQKYWPIGGKILAKNTVRNCIKCFKFKPISTTIPMGNLPKQRVSQSLPFQVTGIDYAGPYNLKDRNGRGARISKCYICVFVCFSTKAIHLELTTTLSTEMFLACLKRFIARRGVPHHIYSDNGTTFIGAHNQLNDFGNFLFHNQDTILHQASQDNISWHFIPPYTPNFGGLWEAAVKSTKYHLKRVLTTAVLTYEEFLTLLNQIEGILNSRPLFALSSDPNDLSPITPSHFLIGRNITALPEQDVTNIPPLRLSRLEYTQQLGQHFWKRWSREYISQLHQQYKWKESSTKLEVGMLVLIKDDKLPPFKWSLGRIHQLIPGPDGHSRVALLTTSKGIIKRSTRSLHPLPLPNHHEINA